jgi:hypothetical protein
MLNYQHVALEGWPQDIPRTPMDERKKAAFKSRWTDTLKLLERELDHLTAHPDRTRFKTFHRPSVVRRDGQLFSNAPLPDNPGVIIVFDVFKWNGTRNDRGQKLGKYVTVQFECDTFTHWKDNVRAIALALEKLRAIERYGVARASAVEVGRKALPAFVGTGMTLDDAWAQLAKFSDFSVEQLQGVGARIKDAYRQAALRTHPDRGGSHDDAAKVNVAYEVLKAHLGLT